MKKQKNSKPNISNNLAVVLEFRKVQLQSAPLQSHLVLWFCFYNCFDCAEMYLMIS